MEKNVAIDIRHVRKVYNTYDREFHRFLEAVSIGRKSYHKNYVALQDVNLTVYKGECVGIIGTNGSGKSTLLKIITGVLSPTSGEMEIDGSISSLLELGAGFNRNYTGIENIYLNGLIMGLPRTEIEKKIPEIERFAGIGDSIHQPVKNYSSGMFARLAFAVAINVDPDILIVDEALSVGDVFFQTKCYQKFNEFRKQGKTILFVSHDLGSVIKYCDRCLLLNQGEQVAVGDSKEVVDMYRKIITARSQQKKFTDPSGKTQEPEAAEEIIPEAEREISGDKQEFRWPKDKVWKTQMDLNPDCQDYGDHRGEILDYGFMNEHGEITGVINKGENFTLLYRFRINSPIERPIFAFTIRDLKGTELCGTNTMYADQIIEEAEAGLTGVVRFTQRMTLQGGQYLLSLGLTGYNEDGELTTYHRLYDVCHLQVFSAIDTVGFFDVDSQVEYDDVHVEKEEGI